MRAGRAAALLAAVVAALAGLLAAARTLPGPLFVAALPVLAVAVVALHTVVAHGSAALRRLTRRRPPR